MHRQKAAFLWARGDGPAAEAALVHALAVARGQGARFFELRAATELARLRVARGADPAGAVGPIRAALAGFAASAAEVPEIRAARAEVARAGPSTPRVSPRVRRKTQLSPLPTKQNEATMAPVKAAWQRFELWFWAHLFIVLIVLGAGTRRRMSHNNGIAGRGTIRIVDDPRFPPIEFFEPGRVFPARLRHASVAYMDDAMRAVRSASLKFADSDFASPLDLQMNTGDFCFFWNGRSFMEFAFSRHESGGIQYTKYYAKHPKGRISAASALLRSPSRFDGLHFHSHTPFAWHARDGKLRYVRFQLIPDDRAQQVPYQDPAYIERMRAEPDQAATLSDQRALPT